LNFLFPVKPNHPDVCGRLDIFAKYGPVLNYHVIDICICHSCRAGLKHFLKEQGNNLKTSKDKILSDEFIEKNKHNFCHSCIDHFSKWSHMYSGFDFTHILTTEEINILIDEMNRNDLLQVLKAEKGSSAETILSKFDLKKPPVEIVYTQKHVLKLLDNVDMDFYDRFSYHELQNLILEDRRIRINYWVYSVIGKRPEYFKNPKLINNIPIKEIHDLSNKNFTLLRTMPVKVKNEEEDKLKATVLEHPALIKQKLTEHEKNLKIEMLYSRNLYQVSTLETIRDANLASNLLLMRNLNLEQAKKNLDNNLT
jgi:arsenate reductase-like glutaredoxin family protein